MKKLFLYALVACSPALGPSQSTTLIRTTKVTDNSGGPANASLTSAAPFYTPSFGLPLAPTVTDGTKLPIAGGPLTGPLYFSGLPRSLGIADMGNVDTSQVVNVKSCGATGNGTTDDTAAIQSCLNSVGGTGRTLYFPCSPSGYYKISSQLTLTLPNLASPGTGIVGENPQCAKIYNPSSSANAVLQVTTSAGNTAGDYFLNFYIRNITLEGNAHVGHDLQLTRPAHSQVENVQMWGANNASGDCLNVMAGVALNVIQPVCDAFVDQSNTAKPFNGIVLLGNNAGDLTTTSTITSPIIEVGGGVSSGTALLLNYAGGITVTSCQISAWTQSLLIENSGANTLIDCLFEHGSVPSSIQSSYNTIDSGTFSGTNNAGGTVLVNGTGNVIRNGTYQYGLTIQSGAVLTRIENEDFGTTQPVDNGVGSYISGIDENPSFNFPSDVTNSDGNAAWAGFANNGPERIHGSWQIPATGVIISPTTVTTGKSWRAILTGTFASTDGTVDTVSMPDWIEINETNAVVTLPDATTMTFSVGSSGFSAVGSACCRIFSGWIYFFPNVSATASGAKSILLQGSAAIKGGATILYRCTSAGNLRVGEITSVASDCGSSVDTGLRTP